MISICIPAYKRVHYLRRLLDSISVQSYKDFEVIITDDSNDDSVEKIIPEYTNRFNLQYFRNSRSLGTPANWNAGIKHATGEWIKLMHDDDWFSHSQALEKFAAATEAGTKFICSAYNNIFENPARTDAVQSSTGWRKRVVKNPGTLLAQNIIGPPSVTLLHRSIKEEYDERLKWRVDMEFYIRVLHLEKSFYYIPETLINVGISQSQVTQSCIYIPSVELPEGFILLQKHGVAALKNIRTYDAWWRLLRNMRIINETLLQQYVPATWPVVIIKMAEDIGKIKPSLLQNGFVSKTMMFLSYAKNYSAIKDIP